MKYHAFISYSHRDKIWGDWLHRSLETYKVPPQLVGKETPRGYAVPARVYPVFRDREELPTATDLGEVIGAALRESRYLVVICSPRSARSQWVNQEIVSFKRLHGEHRVLALIVDGEPNAAEGKPGFTPEQECFPEALKYHLGPDRELDRNRPTEPIAGDARPHADGKANALLKLLAGILGVNYDDLRRRDEMRRRRRHRIMLTTVTSLTVVFAGLAVVAFLQSIEARRQRAVAVKERDRAEEARGVAEQARAAEETARVAAETARVAAEAATRRALESKEQIQESNVAQAVTGGRFDDALLWLEEVRATRGELGLSTATLDARKGVYVARLSRPDWTLAAPGGVNEVAQRAAGAPVWIRHTTGLFRAAPDVAGHWRAEALPWPFEEAEGFGLEGAGGGVLQAADRAVYRFDPKTQEWAEVSGGGTGAVSGSVLTDATTGRLGWLRGTHFEIWDEAAGRVVEERALPALDGFTDFMGLWDSGAGVLAFKGSRAGERRLIVLNWATGDVRFDLPRSPAFSQSLRVAGDWLISTGSGGEKVAGELVLIPLRGESTEPLQRVLPWRARKVIDADDAGFFVLGSGGAVRGFDWALKPQGETVWLRDGVDEQVLTHLPDGWLLTGNDGARWAQDWRALAQREASAGLPDGLVAIDEDSAWGWSDEVLAELDLATGSVRRFAPLGFDAFWPGDTPDEGWALSGHELQRLHLSAADSDQRMTVTVVHRETLPEKTTRLVGAPGALAAVGETGGYEIDTSTGEVSRRWWRGPTRLATADAEGLWTVTEDAALGRLEVRRWYWGIEADAGVLRVRIDPAEVAALTINRDGEQQLTLALGDGTVLALPLWDEAWSDVWGGGLAQAEVDRAQLKVVTGRSGRTPTLVQPMDAGEVMVGYSDGGVAIYAARGEAVTSFSPFGTAAAAAVVPLRDGGWLFRSSAGAVARWRLGDNPRFQRPPNHVVQAGTARAADGGVFYVRDTAVERWTPDGSETLAGHGANSDALSYVALDPGRKVVVGLNRNGVGQYWVANDYGWSSSGQDFPWGQGGGSGSFAWTGPERLVLVTPGSYLPDLTVLRFDPDAESWAVAFSAPLETLGVRHQANSVAATEQFVWLGSEDEPWLSRVDLAGRTSTRVAMSEPSRELALAGPDQQWIVVGMSSRLEWRDAATLATAGELSIPSRITGNHAYYTRAIVALPGTTQVFVGTQAAILQVDLATGAIVHEYRIDGYVWALELDVMAGRLDYVTDLGAGYLPLPAQGELLGRPVDELVPGRAIIQGAATDREPGYPFFDETR